MKLQNISVLIDLMSTLLTLSLAGKRYLRPMGIDRIVFITKSIIDGVMSLPEEDHAFMKGVNFILHIVGHIDEMLDTFIAEEKLANILANGHEEIEWFDIGWY